MGKWDVEPGSRRAEEKKKSGPSHSLAIGKGACSKERRSGFGGKKKEVDFWEAREKSSLTHEVSQRTGPAGGGKKQTTGGGGPSYLLLGGEKRRNLFILQANFAQKRHLGAKAGGRAEEAKGKEEKSNRAGGRYIRWAR